MSGRRTNKGVSGRDRQRQHMQKLRENPDKYELFKKKERERYHANKSKKTKATARDKRSQQKKWRISKAASRKRKEKESDRMVEMERNTPPVSPVCVPATTAAAIAAAAAAATACVPESTDTQKKRGRKMVRRDRSKLARKVQSLQQQLEVQQRRVAKYKKRLQRQKVKMLSTPQKDADKLLRKKQVNGDVRKALQFGSAVFLAIKERYQKSKSHKEKQFIAKIVAKRIRKYRMAKTAHAMLGIPQEAVMIRDDCLLRYNRKTHVSSRRRLSTTVDKFFCREDNSRTTTGKRDTVSKGGIKKQRRLLLDTLSRLYNKYTLENPWSHMSYSLFCTMRPFFVVSPTNKDRETCLQGT